MKNLLLIGDSIRMGYDKSLKKTLEGRANVIFPTDNCRFASYLLRHFHEYLGEINGEDITKKALIHYYISRTFGAVGNKLQRQNVYCYLTERAL